ncbi:MAG: cytochrome C biogenesis protein [Elusimicrobia bacterium CG1_02_37_114]|nr:MAG: cytochrome C biogenesis protein [Elusimicrobia bacterium CG1_02_37_114]PIV53082.1 MAG: cytochrome C biogenesis protein [Elusimicrobia bacterium CG02_land_8_20_14_3_00_37_13]PIZ13555.1 MAG: cytochrome C biogenesis protein [Elusimicrobia bacterium CG_4_10_14_0_8_um_filter_37_32]
MIRTLFEWLSTSIESTAGIAFIASFIWGIFSILLSPCHLSSIPLIVGFIDGQGKVPIKRAFILASLFSTGILITIGVIGAITGLMGRMLGDIGPYGNYIVASILFIVGLYLLEIINIPFLNPFFHTGFKMKGLFASFILGLVFGVAIGPCTFAYMAPMLGIVFKIASTNFVFAMSLILFYAVGHCSVIVLAGTFTGIVQKYLNWNEKSKGAVLLKKVCGILVIIGAIYLVWSTM